MGEAPVGGPEALDGSEEPWGDDQPIDEIRELFVVLGKALRAFQLYDENNPVFRRFVGNLREAFQTLWQEVESLTVHVTEDSLRVGQAEVYRVESRSDSLAFLLYKDGVREATFLPGVEQSELTDFLSVLQQARQLRSEGDDLLTILWEAQLEYFRYQYVDMLAEGVDVPEAGPGADAAELKNVLETELGEVGEEGEEAPKQVKQEDFNPTLYAFDQRETQSLRDDIKLEMARDLRTEVLNALFDRLEESDRSDRQQEILEIFAQLLPNFLSRGALGGASRVLRELWALERQEADPNSPQAIKAAHILDEVSSPEAVDELVYALEEGSIKPHPQALGAFLGFLRGDALRPLLRATETTVVKELRPALYEAVQGIAKRNPTALAGLLQDDHSIILAGAARLAGQMKLAEAGPVLAELMEHEAAEVRLAAVEAATDLRASTAAGALEAVLDDPDRDVRIAAARALGQLRYRPAADRLQEAVEGKELRNADVTEKIAFFEAYGLTAGHDAIDLLNHLLNGKGFLGRREPPEVRACAALALGKVGTREAEEALQFALDEEDPVVRSAVNRALRKDI